MSVKNSKKHLTFPADTGIVSEVKQSRTAVLTSIHEEEVNNSVFHGHKRDLWVRLFGRQFCRPFFDFLGGVQTLALWSIRLTKRFVIRKFD